MGLFRRKSEAGAPVEETIRAFPTPVPEPRADGLRDFAAQRDYLLDILDPLAPFGVDLLDAVGLTLNESITAEHGLPVSGIKVGDILVREGVRIQPRLIGLFAALGVDKVITRPRPRIVVIPVVRPGETPSTGHDLASFLVAAELQAQGSQVWHVPAQAQDEADLARLINDQMIRADLIVTTGGFAPDEISVTQVLGEVGVVDATPVAITPGRQQAFALVGDDAVPLLALPSDPLAAHVLLATLVIPVARKLIGADAVLPPVERGRVTQPVSVTPGLLTCAHVIVGDSGTLSFRARRQGADALVAINRANGIVLLESDGGHIDIGSWVDYIPLVR
ncbi:MAG: hypothetical protein LBS56_05750 [Propionibacteriaceae bacterium]|jgi:molybdopterin molybdotransferase|nr:hypothetical protein [Propionibacteriaceae bacterium]